MLFRIAGGQFVSTYLDLELLIFGVGNTPASTMHGRQIRLEDDHVHDLQCSRNMMPTFVVLVSFLLNP